MDRHQKVTNAQRARLIGMIESGLVTRKEMQVFIEKFRPIDLNDPLVYWEGLSPGNGVQIMKTLRPFYEWKPALKSWNADHLPLAQKAIFWSEINGVRVFHHAGEVRARLSLRDSLRNSCFDTLEDSFRFSFQTSFRDTLGTTLHNELGDAIWIAYRDSSVRVVRDQIWNSCWDSSWESFWSSVWDSLRASLFYATSSILTDKPSNVAKFKPLFELWLAGNFPVGFDRDNNLLILVEE